MNLLKTLLTVSSMTMLSRILGFVRDALIARMFGAGALTDAFFVAFKLPNLLRRVFAEGAFSQAFVPVLAEYREHKTSGEIRQFLAHIAGMLSLALFVVTLLGIALAPWIVMISAPGFRHSPEKFQITVELLRWIFPYIFLISLSSLLGSVLNTWRQFSIPAFTPALLNLSFIACTLWLAPHLEQPIFALAFAVLIGGVAQLVFQVPALKKTGMLVLPRLSFRDAAVGRVIKQMGPAIFGVSVSQISLIINTIFASFLISGSVSWMYYADRLMELPTGVLGVALGTILLPSLSKHAAAADFAEFSALLDWGLRLSLLLALPSALGVAILAEPLVATLFMYGKFAALDMQMTAQALMAYALGLLALILVKVLAPAFYSRHDIKTPVKIAVVTLIMTQVFNLLLIWHLRHVGLALAISLGACLNAALLFWQIKKQGFYQAAAGWAWFLARLFLALLLMAVVLQAAMWFGQFDWFAAAWWRAVQLALLIGLGVLAYFASLFVLGFRLKDFVRRER